MFWALMVISPRILIAHLRLSLSNAKWVQKNYKIHVVTYTYTYLLDTLVAIAIQEARYSYQKCFL